MVKTQKYRMYSVMAGPDGGGGLKSTNRTYAYRRRKRKYIKTFPMKAVTGANQN